MEEKIVILTIGGHEFKIYSLPFLEKLKFTARQIDEFIETDVLYNSFCVGVIREMNWEHGKYMSVKEALELMTSNRDWYKTVYWSPLERVDYEKRFARILMKVLDYDFDEAWHEVEIWSGFGSAPSLFYPNIGPEDDRRLYDKYMSLHDAAYKETIAAIKAKKAAAKKRKFQKALRISKDGKTEKKENSVNLKNALEFSTMI